MKIKNYVDKATIISVSKIYFELMHSDSDYLLINTHFLKIEILKLLSKLHGNSIDE